MLTLLTIARVQDLDYFSPIIQVERGVRQGGPNSSFLLLHCAELLAIKLRQNEKIQGLPVDDIVYLLSQYADHMDSFLLGSAEVLHKFFRELNWFKTISGFTVNYDKTSINRIGSLRNSNAKFYTERQLFWTNNPINVLGVWITPDNDVIEKNYRPVIQKAQVILE